MATKIRPKINQNCTDFSSVPYNVPYNACMYSRVFGVSEFKYANKKFKGAKGVAITTNLHTQKQKCTDFSFVRDIVTTFTFIIGFSGL